MPPQRRHETGPEAERPEYAGQYRLENRLGSGGMGVVHLSRSTSGKRLAVKVVHQELATDPEFRARFRQEIAAARRVSGAFTAPVVDADPDAERPWMATLYIPGPTLAEFVKRNGPVPPAQVRYLMAGLSEALRDIHRAGVVHRDLKPSNVLLAADGPKVIDFGISRPPDSDLRTETGKLIGTPPFMAPEQFQQPRTVGPAADVFAMASVLVHAATGRSPFDSESPYIVAYQIVHEEPQLEGLPADLRPLIESCLAKDPDERPSPDALMAELRAVSASYDTQTFAAFDFEGIRTDGLIPAQRQPADDETTHETAPESVPRRADTEPAFPPHRVRGMRKAAVGVTALALIGLGATTVALDRVTGFGSQDGKHRGSPVSTGAAFRPWTTALPNNSEGRMAACTHGSRALFCSGPGVEAASLDPHSGLFNWSIRTARRPGTTTTVRAPVLSNGVLRVMSGDESRLTGLNPATGSPRWTLDVSAYEGVFYDAGTAVLLVGHNGMISAVDGTTGKTRWHRKLPGHANPMFAALGLTGVVYAVEVSPDGLHTLVTAVNQDNGAVRHRIRLDGNLTFADANGKSLFFTSEDRSSARTDAVVRLNTADWTARRIRLARPVDQPRASAQGDMVYLLGPGGLLMATDTSGRDDGAATPKQWRVETSVAGSSEPAVSGNRLYFTAADGRLLAFDTEQGSYLGQTKPRLGAHQGTYPGFPPSPVVADGKVFATAPDGSVFAVDAKDPSRW